jgi:biotin carboxylase
MRATPASQEGDDLPLIVLVTSGYHLYREYLMTMLARAARVWLLNDVPPTWQSRYIVGHTVVDTLDADAMTEAVRAVAAEAPVAGIVCWDEIKMVVTARVAEALGLPGGQPEAVGRCRDKHQTRVALAAGGVGQAISTLVSSRDEARDAAVRIGYPVVLKPRALGASFGVQLVRNWAELEVGFGHARAAREDGVPYFSDGVLVEEYLDGPEISIDAACQGGVLTPLFVARKTCGFPPYFEETGHSVDASDPLLHDPQLLDLLQAAHSAVGYRDGITHTEVRLTTGGPKIIEINARLGGDLIPHAGVLATGIDPGEVATDVACGVPARTRPTLRRVAAVRFMYPSQDVIAAGVEIDEQRLPQAVEVFGALAGPGQELLLPPGGNVTCRYAYAIAVGDAAAECESALDEASAAMTLLVERELAQDREAA